MATDLKNLKPGADILCMYVRGNSVRFKKDKVLGVEDGKLITDTFAEWPMKWDEQSKTWVLNELGVKVSVRAPDDPLAMAYFSVMAERPVDKLAVHRKEGPKNE